jgi:hypothetical protein
MAKAKKAKKSKNTTVAPTVITCSNCKAMVNVAVDAVAEAGDTGHTKWKLVRRRGRLKLIAVAE